jgi:predicted RNA-binding Zn ribbon-like protein
MPLTEMERGSGLAVAVDLINTRDELVAEPDLLHSADWLRRWLSWHGFPVAAASIRDGDLEPARDLRATLTAAFDAADEASAVDILNELAATAATPPVLEPAPDGWRFRTWPDERAGLDFAAAYAAVGLLDAVRDGGFARFGRCAGAPCTCVFVDRSRNRSRRYCCQLCADRVAQAAYRARNRG